MVILTSKLRRWASIVTQNCFCYKPIKSPDNISRIYRCLFPFDSFFFLLYFISQWIFFLCVNFEINFLGMRCDTRFLCTQNEIEMERKIWKWKIKFLIKLLSRVLFGSFLCSFRFFFVITGFFKTLFGVMKWKWDFFK